jgi:taurine dioxygenase
MRITPTTDPLGARIDETDLNEPLSDSDFRVILRSLGQYGVLCFPEQDLTPDTQAAFGRRFGEPEINIAAAAFHEPGHPELMILSNMKQDGRPLGLHDAGQDWHTDMSYSKDVAIANILHARHVPTRNGRPLGETQFRDMHRAYDELPDALKTKLAGRTATHDFNNYWEQALLRPGTGRKPLTEAQRRTKPPVSQPLFRIHPITGRPVLYANPGYTVSVDGMEREESDAILDFLFRHQTRADFFHAHQWAVGDVLMWDNIGTVHNAVADYTADEPRYMRRLQIMATLDYAALAG